MWCFCKTGYFHLQIELENFVCVFHINNQGNEIACLTKSLNFVGVFHINRQASEFACLTKTSSFLLYFLTFVLKFNEKQTQIQEHCQG